MAIEKEWSTDSGTKVGFSWYRVKEFIEAQEDMIIHKLTATDQGVTLEFERIK